MLQYFTDSKRIERLSAAHENVGTSRIFRITQYVMKLLQKN